jgi:sortase (surface protein transpeptidase)
VNPFGSPRGRLVIVVIAGGLLAGTATQLHGAGARSAAPPAPAFHRSSVPTTTSTTMAPAATAPKAKIAPVVPAALTAKTLSLRAGPVAVPLALSIPSIGLHAQVLGVGMSAKNVMDAPMGRADNPDWQQAFWYRGSAIPGARSTALLAGHVNDPLGRPAVFAHLDQLRQGDLIVLRDTRTQLDVRFVVTLTATYSLEHAKDPSVLARMYGSGPVRGTAARRSADGRAHLTLVTCAGAFDNGLGTHDHRLAVYAVRLA